jgi:hypothetical protein
VRERETAEEARRDRRFELAEISFVNRRIDITQLKVQSIDQLGALLAEILNGSLSFTNRLSKLAEVVGRGQLIPAPQDYGCDAATVYRIVFVLPVKRTLSVGPERVNDADVAPAFCQHLAEQAACPQLTHATAVDNFDCFLIIPDETAATTKMTRLYGRVPQGTAETNAARPRGAPKSRSERIEKMDQVILLLSGETNAER